MCLTFNDLRPLLPAFIVHLQRSKFLVFSNLAKMRAVCVLVVCEIVANATILAASAAAFVVPSFFVFVQIIPSRLHLIYIL